MKTIQEKRKSFIKYIEAEDSVKIAPLILRGYRCKWEGFFVTKRDLEKYKNKMDTKEKRQFWYKGIPIQSK